MSGFVNPGLPARGYHSLAGILPIRPDVHTRKDNLRVVLRQQARFFNEFRDAARPVGPAREGRRAERAMFVAAVLDFQQSPGSGV